MQRGEPKLSACVAKHRAAGMKVAITTVLEMEVLTYLEREYLELRERLIRKRAEMVRRLQDMGYGPDDNPLHDWGIPPDVRLWLMEKQRHIYLKEQVQQIYAELTDRKVCLTLAEGVLDAAEHQTSMQSCGPATATIVSRLSVRVAQLADAGVKAAQTVMFEMMVLENFEQRCAVLSEQVSSRRAEMTGKLHKMGYGVDDAPQDDQSIPEDIRTWLSKYKDHMDLKGRIEKLRADFIDQESADPPLHGRQKPHVDLKELVKGLAAELTNEPLASALLPAKLDDLPHATCHMTTLRSRRGGQRR